MLQDRLRAKLEGRPLPAWEVAAAAPAAEAQASPPANNRTVVLQVVGGGSKAAKGSGSKASRQWPRGSSGLSC